MKKRILSALLALAMTFSLMPAAALAADVKDFTDLNKDAWYYEYVAEIVEDGYMVGTSETTFSPDMALDRAMFVVIIAAIEDVKVDNTKETKFSDVPANTWYTGAVNWAVKAGITAGTGDGKFEPTRAITREEMATMMNAYIEWNDSVKKAGVKADAFADEADIADWAEKSVEAVRKYGLIAGVPALVDGAEVRNFLPKKTASRAEIATVISNLAFFVGGGGGGKKPVYTDYIYEAMENVVATVKAEVEEQIGEDIKDTNADGVFGVYGDSSYAQIAGLKLSDAIDENGARPQVINGTISVDQDTIVNLVKTAIEYAMPIYNDIAGGADVKEEAADIAQSVIDKFEEETGVAVTKENAKKIVEAIKAKVKASPEYARNLWADNFIVDGEYITGDITVSSEYGAEAVISVNAETGASMQNKKAEAVELALAIAKDLYADLKACEEYTAINEIVLDATVTVEFSAGAYKTHTDKYPYVYPFTVSMALEGDALDFVEYKFDDGQFIKVIIPEGVQAVYTSYANKLINKVITPIITEKMNEALGSFMVKPAAASTYAITFAPTIDTSALMNDAVSAWLDKNLTTGDIANSALLDYMNGNTAAELDNEVIYEMIDTTLDDTLSSALDGSVVPGGALAVEMAKDPEKLKETLETAAPDAFKQLEDMGLADYAVSKTQDYLDPSKAEETGKSYAEEKREEMKETVDKVITSTIDKTIAPSKPADPETPDVDVPEIDVPEIEIPEVVVPDVSGYVTALNVVAKMTSVDNIAAAKFSNIAAALRNEMFQELVGTKGDATVAKLTKLISKLPAAASVEIDGLVISEATLEAVRQANSTIEACEAIADLIDEIGSMSINSFADGEDIIVKYGEKSWLANLMIVIE